MRRKFFSRNARKSSPATHSHSEYGHAVNNPKRNRSKLSSNLNLFHQYTPSKWALFGVFKLLDCARCFDIVNPYAVGSLLSLINPMLLLIITCLIIFSV